MDKEMVDDNGAKVPAPEDFTAEDEEEDDFVTLNMHQIVDNLWIGDFMASQQFPILRESTLLLLVSQASHRKHCVVLTKDGITVRQKYKAPDDFQMHRVLVEDTNKTNMLCHFDETFEIISKALKANKGILVHCQAGVSRSTTLVAAYLMREHSLTADEAIAQISAIRSQVEPTQFFLQQLEMYERMNYEVDPAKHAEYRRFLMNFNHNEMMQGDGTVDSLYLAYYPTPAMTPRERSQSDPFANLRMSSLPSPTTQSSMVSSPTELSRNPSESTLSRKGSTASLRRPSTNEPIRRRRSRLSNDFGLSSELSMTSTKPSSSTSTSGNAGGRAEIVNMLNQVKMDQAESELRRRPSRIEADRREGLRAEARKLIEGKEKFVKVGQGRVVIKGRRLRCRMCRRELAAREHIVEHEPGKGQQAFAPRKRDMVQHRLDAEKKRNAATPPAASTSGSGTLQERRPAHFGALRVAMPLPLTAATPTMSTEESANVSAKEAEANDCAIEEDEDDVPEPPTAPLLCSVSCSSYFVEPLSWMSEQLDSGVMGGKLTCPDAKCQAKLGNFDWAGLQCSCGAWVVPAFSIAASKVDEVDF